MTDTPNSPQGPDPVARPVQQPELTHTDAAIAVSPNWLLWCWEHARSAEGRIELRSCVDDITPKRTPPARLALIDERANDLPHGKTMAHAARAIAAAALASAAPHVVEVSDLLSTCVDHWLLAHDTARRNDAEWSSWSRNSSDAATAAQVLRAELSASYSLAKAGVADLLELMASDSPPSIRPAMVEVPFPVLERTQPHLWRFGAYVAGATTSGFSPDVVSMSFLASTQDWDEALDSAWTSARAAFPELGHLDVRWQLRSTTYETFCDDPRQVTGQSVGLAAAASLIALAEHRTRVRHVMSGAVNRDGSVRPLGEQGGWKPKAAAALRAVQDRDVEGFAVPSDDKDYVRPYWTGGAASDHLIGLKDLRDLSRLIARSEYLAEPRGYVVSLHLTSDSRAMLAEAQFALRDALVTFENGEIDSSSRLRATFDDASDSIRAAFAAKRILRTRNIANSAVVVSCVGEVTPNVTQDYEPLRFSPAFEEIVDEVAFAELWLNNDQTFHPFVVEDRGKTKFVGRDDALDTLTRAWQLARNGHAQYVDIGGEEGIGKTRLVRRFCESTANDQPAVFFVACEQGESVTDIASRLLHDYVSMMPTELLRGRLGEWAPAVVNVVPALGDRFPALATKAHAHRHASDGLRPVIDMLLAVAREQPVVIVVDDAYKATTASTLLRRLAQAAADDAHGRVLILATFRTSDPDASLQRDSLRGEVARRLPVHRIDLRGLDIHDLHPLVEAVCESPVANDLVESALRRSGGNPLYVEFSGRQLLFDSERPDARLNEVILHRLNDLSKEVRRLLGIAAIAGSTVDPSLMSEVASDVSIDSVVEFLSVAEQTGVLMSDNGQLQFTHGYVRECVLSQLSDLETRSLHQRVAEALVARDERGMSPDAGVIVAHLLGSESMPGSLTAGRLFHYSRIAALRTAEQSEYEASRRYCDIALRHLVADADDQGVAELHLLKGEALAFLGREESAVTTLGDARTLATKIGGGAEAEILARAALALAGPLQRLPTWGFEPEEEERRRMVVEWLETAQGRLTNQEALLRHVETRLAIERAIAGAEPASSESPTPQFDGAVRAAREAGDNYDLAWAIAARLFVDQWLPSEDPHQRLELAQEMRRAAELAGEVPLEAWAIGFCLIHSLELGDLDGVDHLMREFDLTAARWHTEHARWAGCTLKAMRALLASEFSAVDGFAVEATRHWRGSTARVHLHVQRLLAAREQGHRGLLEDPIVRHFVSDEAIGSRTFGAALAMIEFSLGREAVARDQYDDLIGRLDDVPRDFLYLETLCLLAELAASFADVDGARRLYGVLEEYETRVIVIGYAMACAGPVARYLGLLAGVIALRDSSMWPRAEAHLLDALDTCSRRLRSAYLEAHCRYDLGWLYASDSRFEDAERESVLARRIAEELRMKPLVKLCDQLDEDVANQRATSWSLGVIEKPLQQYPAGRRRRRKLIGRIPRYAAAGAREVLPWHSNGRGIRARFEAGAAQSLSSTFQQLGGAFAKAGQLIGSAPGLFGTEFSDAFRDCLDTGPPLAPEIVRRLVREELGRDIHELFDTFVYEPVAAASIAVVHRATVDGHPVAVKLLRPGIETTVAEDVGALEGVVVPLFRGMTQGAALVTFVRTLRAQIEDEVDLQLEASSMARFRARYELADFDRLIVPEVVPSHSTRRMLTMQFVDGVSIDKPEAIHALRRDPTALRQLLRAWMTTAVMDGEFHGDGHAGNLLVLPQDGRIAVIDWGIVGRLDPSGRLLFENLLRGSLSEDLGPWKVIAELYRDAELLTYGAAWGMTIPQAAMTVRKQMRPALTAPLREVDLGSLVVTPSVIREVLGADGEERPGRLASFQNARETMANERHAQRSGARGSDFDVSGWMLAKQLLYIDRYLKAVLPDEPLIADRAFLEELLTQH